MADQKSKFSLFGFRIGRKEDEAKQELIQPSFAPPSNEDGALTITSAAQFGTSAIDLDGSAKNEIELITRYREMAMQPEVESAIDDIVNEAIVHDDDGKSLEIVLDNLKQTDKIKKAIKEEFDTIIKLLNYDNMGTDIFRRYYIDGRLNYHIIVDIENPQKGIQELRYIDPRKIRKIREVKKQKDSVTGVDVVTKVAEYYVFAERMNAGPTNNPIGGVKIAPDSILNVTSGLMDARRGMVLSYLHKAIKPLNQLRMVEDAVVIYRISRAPERRVFYVDVGNLPRIKAEQYVRDMMTKYKNKLVYDACLDLNTMIPLMDGRKLLLKEIIMEFNDGKELWAYSCNPETGEFAPGLITWAGVTKLDQKVVRITLENRKQITCTLDHKFPIWGKGFVEAKDLDYDDVMMSFDDESDSNKESGIKVIEMEILKETMNVGTLTIDGDEIHHNYHTFALDVGVYTKNSTGEVRDDRRHLSMLEDFWLPRRSDSKSTEITTLPSGQNLGQMEDVQYFEKKLYKSLNVPVTRLDPSQAVSIGRSTEITRDELKFSRFIDKLRNKFSELFDSALRVQLVLKGVCTDEEWKEFRENISYDFIKDNKFVELKEAELMQERLGILAIIDQYSGKYYSRSWIQKNVLRLKDLEIEQMEKEIDAEKDVDFQDQSEDQTKQIQLQAQAMELQNQLMPQQEPQIDANAPEQQNAGGGTDVARSLHKTENEQIKGKRTPNPYAVQQ